MTFIIALIALVIERFFHWGNSRHWHWFSIYQQRITQQVSNLNSYLLLILIVAPLMILVGLIDWVLNGYFYGLLKLVFGIGVLLYCMGPDNLWLQAYGALNSFHKEDPNTAIDHAQKVFNIPLPANSQALHQALTGAIFVAANQRIFAVIFWFILLGPVGAVMYRAIALCVVPNALGVSEAASQAQKILDWIPIRILTLIFALGGHFKEVISCWKKEAPTGPERNEKCLVDCGIAALDVRNGNLLPENGEAEKEALELLDRSFIIMLVILAMIVIMFR